MKTIRKSELMKMLGSFVAVRNTAARNGYGDAPNQFEIQFENGRVFQSYRTMIAAWVNGQLYLTDAHTYSNTTSAHCGRWCGWNAKERRQGLETGQFIYVEED